jgi:hypothetical protein
MRAKKTILMNNQNFVLTEAFKETLKKELSELIEYKLNSVKQFVRDYNPKRNDEVCVHYIGELCFEISKIAEVLKHIHKCEQSK